MTYWEQGQKLDNTVASSKERSNRANPKTKIRADVIIPEDSPESQELIDVMGRRLLPEVLKGFAFRVSRMEHFRVGCYDSMSGGHFAPHLMGFAAPSQPPRCPSPSTAPETPDRTPRPDHE